MIPRTKQNLSARKTIITLFFISTGLFVPNFLPTGTKFDQDYFIDAVLPELYTQKTRIARCKGVPSFSVNMDNSMCHNGAKVTEKLTKKHIARALHPFYSPDFSPCKFWLFGMGKEKMKDRAFRSEQHILATRTQS
jgi:hypothetical protein